MDRGNWHFKQGALLCILVVVSVHLWGLKVYGSELAILAPNGGEIIPSGSNYIIDWNAPPQAENFKLQYSLNNGKDWKTIAKGIVGTNYDWEVPTPTKNKKNCLMRLTGYNASGEKVKADKSDAPFAIEVMNVTSPNGGEVLASGGSFDVTWGTNGTKITVDYVQIFCSTNNGETWKLMTTESGNPGTSPCLFPITKKNEKDCLVEVIAYNSADKKVAQDKSDAPFTIEVVTITSPNGGETLKYGNTHTIEWNTYETRKEIYKVLMSYTKNGGETWEKINTIKSNNPGIYLWKVPGLSKTKKCKVKIVLKDDKNRKIGSDVSDEYFSIAKRAVPTDAAWRLFATSAFGGGFPPAIWAAADDDAYVGGRNGRIYNYDGSRWMPIETFTNSEILYIWGFDSNDVYAVGDGVYHYDGSSWTLMPGSPNGWRIWGTGPDDLFMSGNGEVYHYDGSTWTTTVIPGAYTLWEFWGSAGDDVFVVGNKGKIYHYNGTDWSAMNSGTSSNICEVWGTDSYNVYAITLNAVLHYDGTGWSSIPINIDYPYDYLLSIWGNAADNIYFSTSTALMLFNGTEWQQVASAGANNIWGSNTKVFLAGGEIGVYESNSYKTHFFESGERILTVAGSAANNVLLGGMWTYGLLYNGQEWQFLYPTYGKHPNFHFYFAWVIDENNILAGDDNEIKYYDGTSWWSHRIPYGSIDTFQDAWAQSSSDGFVVASSGCVYQFTNDYGLTEMDTPTSEDLQGVWGCATDNVYAVGDRGTILHYNGSDWLEVSNPATQNLNAVWGNGPQDIYAVGNSGTIVHYDGTDWSVMAAGQFSMLFRDVWGFAHDNIYVAGSDGLVHYDGNGWSILDTGYNLDLEAVWGSDPENIYLVDHQGNVYRYSE